MSFLDAIKVGVTAGVNAGISVAQRQAPIVQASADNVGRTYRDYDNQHAKLEVIDNLPRVGDPVTLDSMLLQGVGENFYPKNSATYTFGNSVVFSSGEGPREFNYTGIILVNDADEDPGNKDARLEAQQLYDRTLRLSQSFSKGVEKQAIRLTYRDQVRLGYLTSFSTSLNAINLNRVDVSFTMFVTESYSNGPATPTRAAGRLTVAEEQRQVAQVTAARNALTAVTGVAEAAGNAGRAIFNRLV